MWVDERWRIQLVKSYSLMSTWDAGQGPIDSNRPNSLRPSVWIRLSLGESQLSHR